MIKFVSILISVLSLNFMVSFTARDKDQLEEIEVDFSTTPIGFESGQPVFSKDTKVVVSKTAKENMKLHINEEEKELSSDKIELAGLKEGTYTIMVVEPEKKKSIATVGFTIQ